MQLELGNGGAAWDAFEAAAKGKKATPAAQAFVLYAGMLSEGDADSKTVLEKLEELAKGNTESADVHRAFGLAAMHEAQSLGSRNRRRRSLEGARDLLRQGVALNPNHVLLRYDLCRVELILGKREDADEGCGAAFELNHAYKAGAAHLIELRLLEERYAEALTLVAMSAAHFAGEPVFELNTLKIEALIGLRRFEEAEKELQGLRARGREQEVTRGVLQGRLAFAQHFYENAMEHFERAHMADGEHEEAATRLGHSMVRVGYWDEADALLQELLSSDRWGPLAWYALGELRRRQRRFPDARVNLRRAGKRYAEQIGTQRFNVLINTELALAWQDRFNWNNRQVQRHLEIAAKTAEEHGLEVLEFLLIEGLYHLARRKAEPELARESIEKATALDPLQCGGWTALAATYRALGERAELRGISKRRPSVCS